MAECFKCGAHVAPGEGVRREVYTGHSSRMYYGRGIAGSTGRNYGIRTLCRDCAARLDTGKTVVFWTVISALAIFIAAAATSNSNPPHSKAFHTRHSSTSRRFLPAAYGLTDAQGQQLGWVACGITKTRGRNPHTPFSDRAMAVYFAGLCPDLRDVPAPSLSALVKLETADIRSGVLSCRGFTTPDPSLELDKQRYSPCGD
jgi:hypothetical protein